MQTQIAVSAAAAALLAFPSAQAQEKSENPEAPRINWTAGPAQVDVGVKAEMRLPESMAFAGAEDTRRILERMGNPTNGDEVGLVVPKAQDQNWFIVYEYRKVGFVKDDEKDKIDAAGLLKSLTEATEASNEERKKMGAAALHVLRWQEPPRYDERTHNLTWATLAHSDDGHDVVNYNVRVLGREGYMSVTLVDDARSYGAAKPAVEQALASFSYKRGSSYAEWVPGDKVAQYGLAGLVAAGAGAAAVKLGLFGTLAKLFAKAGKFIVVGIAALGALAAKLWSAARGRAAARPPSAGA